MPSTLKYPLDRIYVTQGFGLNEAMYRPFGLKGHNGIDFRTAFLDTPKGHRYVYPMAPGKVIEVGDEDLYILGKRVKGRGYGKFVRILYFDGAQAVFGHLEKQYVRVGMSVSTKDVIGLTGNTGFSTGSHLHVGYRPPNWQALYNNGFKGYVDFIKLLTK